MEEYKGKHFYWQLYSHDDDGTLDWKFRLQILFGWRWMFRIEQPIDDQDFLTGNARGITFLVEPLWLKRLKCKNCWLNGFATKHAHPFQNRALAWKLNTQGFAVKARI